ncbi:uncharacterized protein LOC110444583 [Mizuhopecten yessoensis]|uniref:uncharacterized protein LOC110444583 n=1 Tax=Mizuhopecten yessoensis TaxID=6573 RepID=UPI000B459D38|nr:uncharacterized protein LOC110444583 [Mizuhopecten yessoensis]
MVSPSMMSLVKSKKIGITDGQNITNNGPLCLDQIMNSFDDESIGKENLKHVVQELRRHLIRCLEIHVAPDDNVWGTFLLIMSKLASIQLSLLKNAEDMTDIINVLKREKFRKCHFRAYSCLMKTVRQIDFRYSRGVGPLYNKIVKLDKQYRESVKVQITSQEEKNQMTGDGDERISFTASPAVTDIEDAISSGEDDDDNDVFCPYASAHFLGMIEANGRYIYGNKMYERVSLGSTNCGGFKRSINKRIRSITI